MGPVLFITGAAGPALSLAGRVLAAGLPATSATGTPTKIPLAAARARIPLAASFGSSAC